MEKIIDIEFTDTESEIMNISSDDNSESDEPIIYMIDSLSTDEMIEFESMILEEAFDYLDSEIIRVYDDDFDINMIEDITHIIYQSFLDAEMCNDYDYESIYELVKNIIEIAYDICELPARSISMQEVENYTNSEYIDIDKVGEQINLLKQQPQMDQRTTEWYEERYRLLTASNLWKVFGSECQKNSLIYEKCKPLHINTHESTGEINTDTSLHWGVKYEPITRMMYEWKYGTQVCDFGVIKHSAYSFIGASPDGIIVNPDSDRFGYMLEIKNIVNREINGIPSKEYWIQMQIQMETCNLDKCDFVETRFKQYETETEFNSDTTKSWNEKGVILYFINKSLSLQGSPPIYMYSPIGLDLNGINQWTDMIKEKHKNEFVLYEKIYWYLDQFSCVRVERNRLWFKKALPQIRQLWQTIEKERLSGYEHRAAKKRKPTISTSSVEVIRSEEHMTIQSIRNIPITNSICLIKLDHD